MASPKQRQGDRPSTVPGTPSKRGRKRHNSETESISASKGVKKRQKKGSGLFSIRDILEEDDHKGYLIDWADNPVSGEKYEPTWVIVCNASLIASQTLTKPFHRNQKNSPIRPPDGNGRRRKERPRSARPRHLHLLTIPRREVLLDTIP